MQLLPGLKAPTEPETRRALNGVPLASLEPARVVLALVVISTLAVRRARPGSRRRVRPSNAGGTARMVGKWRIAGTSWSR